MKTPNIYSSILPFSNRAPCLGRAHRWCPSLPHTFQRLRSRPPLGLCAVMQWNINEGDDYSSQFLKKEADCSPYLLLLFSLAEQ